LRAEENRRNPRKTVEGVLISYRLRAKRHVSRQSVMPFSSRIVLDEKKDGAVVYWEKTPSHLEANEGCQIGISATANWRSFPGLPRLEF
jgi:hypothetical protein